MKLRAITDVPDCQLCCGCGACASVYPGAIEMVDDLSCGRRPVVRASEATTAAEASGSAGSDDRVLVDALRVCPGVDLGHDRATNQQDQLDPDFAPLWRHWGPITGMWEGHATDPEINRAGSSGGAVTALGLFCIEDQSMHGVIHTAARSDIPYLNETVCSRSRAELIANTGSRYAPSSPADGLHLIENAPNPCVFVGKPCDVAAVAKARRIRPELDRNIGLTIAFFCAGTPSTQGTLDLMAKAGVTDPASVRSVRYRGNGWPGRWVAAYVDREGAELEASMTYEESWGFLEKYRQWRCYICPDHTGEFADIAMGDPWYREPKPGEVGRSLIVARTPRGKAMVERAIEAGYLTARAVQADLLPRSQGNLLKTRGRIWGQLLALRLAGVPVPRYRGFSLWRSWVRELSLQQKVSSILGTLKRVHRKRLRHKCPVVGFTPGGPVD